MRKSVEELRARKKRAEDDLAITKANLKECQEKVAILKEDGAIKQAELDDLTAKSNLMQRKLNTAQNLVRDLSSEKERWGI